MTKLKIEAEKRDATRARVKALRTNGLVPVVVYGRGVETQNLQVGERNLATVLQNGGMSQLVELSVKGGSTQNVLVREVQRHHLNHRPIHVDLYAVRMDEKQQVEVPLHGVGKPSSLASDVMVLQNRETVLVEALPADLPVSIEVSIVALSPDHPIMLADLPQIPGVTYIADEHDHFFSMQSVGGELAKLEAEAAAEVTAAEPEVVSKGKDDEE